ncbi:hydroxyacid dehydrogenase [Planctomycetaceae bacterium SCGC AG-212-D15]|nr:hydroxyacid dehydrogenase [Planctomycetaceae bacterium SCGC AG-212-D15]
MIPPFASAPDSWLALLFPTVITIVVVLAVIQGVVAYLILVERKISAYVQDRIGPNRVGPFGLLQPIVDGLKFLLKEDVIPARVDMVLFLAAPAIAFSAALLAFAVVPFGPTSVPESYSSLDEYRTSYQFVIAPGVDIGILFIFAIGSLTVYGILLGGWSSNNKYSFLGALRSSAQLISYEIPMGMSILGILLLSGSLNLERIIDVQTRQGWFVLYQPLAFLLFLTATFAECNRVPFDLPEAEQELVGGYHTEYSALKFGLFFLAEYTHVITTSMLLSIVFFGGWHLPYLAEPGDGHIVLKVAIICLKCAGFIIFSMWVRWTIPRFRFDQLMGIAWKVLIPLSLANLVCVMVVKEFGLSLWWLLPASFVVFVGAGVISLLMPKAPPRSIRHVASVEA